MAAEKVVIRKLVLDVMKPHKPGMVDLGKEISALVGIDGCNITLIELDKKVENVKVTIEGSDINFEKLNALIEDNSATIHSIDKVSTGLRSARLVEEAEYKH